MYALIQHYPIEFDMVEGFLNVAEQSLGFRGAIAIERSLLKTWYHLSTPIRF